MAHNNVRKISFWRVFFPSLIALLVASIISIIFFFSTLTRVIDKYSTSTEPELKDNTFLHLTFDKTVGDVGYGKIDLASYKLSQQQGLSEIIYGLQKAKDDPKIKGIFLEVGQINIGYGNLYELRQALKDFEKSGKKVVIYASGEVVTTKSLYLSTISKDNYIFPKSNVEFLGLSSQVMFFKNLLDKLDIKVQVIRGEGNDFKSAVEPYFRTNMSDSSRYQVSQFLNGIWSQVVDDMAKDCNLSSTSLNQLASDAKILNGEDAQKAGLFKATKYRGEILDLLKHYAGVSGNKEANLYSFSKYARDAFRKAATQKKDENSIALIFAEGDIATGGDGISSENTCKYLREARNDDHIKTVIFRVNSPGGSALASEEIWKEVSLTAQKKKVYVSMGNLAASGGYYISSAGTRIFADPTTITGSIGVFGVIPDFGEALEKHAGITFDGVKTNPFANISLFRALTPEELAIIQREVNSTYGQFIQRVSDGRKIPQNRGRQNAKGHVWLGLDAKKIGLIDEFGGLTDVIAYAKKQVGDLPISVWPKVEGSDLRDILDMVKNSQTKMTVDGNPTSKVSDELMKYYQEVAKVQDRFGIQMRLPYDLNL